MRARIICVLTVLTGKGTKMMRLLLSAVIVAMPGIGMAACQHYEFAELNSMSKARLETEYCEVTTEIELQQSEIVLNRSLRAEELHYRGSPNTIDYARLGAASDQAYGFRTQCSHEQERILEAFKRKNGNEKKLTAKCPDAP